MWLHLLRVQRNHCCVTNWFVTGWPQLSLANGTISTFNSQLFFPTTATKQNSKPTEKKNVQNYQILPKADPLPSQLKILKYENKKKTPKKVQTDSITPSAESISAMESDDPEKFLAFQHHPPNFITLSPFSPACYPSPSRRLSSCFTEPSRPVRAARRLAWVSLQGRLVGAEEASSAKTIAGENGSLFSRTKAVAWELFSPIHRILIVTVIAVAVANSKRNRQIF